MLSGRPTLNTRRPLGTNLFSVVWNSGDYSPRMGEDSFDPRAQVLFERGWTPAEEVTLATVSAHRRPWLFFGRFIALM